MNPDRKPPLSFKERQTIESLLHAQLTKTHIAKALHRSNTCIKFEIRRNGGRDAYNAESAHNQALIREKFRKRAGAKEFSPAQIEIIKEGVEKKLSMSRIRIVLGCSYGKLSRYFIEHGIEYLPRPFQELEKRIECIEMQIEIIVTQLKEINERNSKN